MVGMWRKDLFLRTFPPPREMAAADSQDGPKIDLGDWGVYTKLFIAVLIIVIEYKRRRLLINEIICSFADDGRKICAKVERVRRSGTADDHRPIDGRAFSSRR